MHILLIDDLRNLEMATKTVRTFEEGIDALQERIWEILYLDHDLGQPEPKNGYQILCWLEEHFEHCPRAIVLVTANPVGRKKMEMVLKKLFSN